MKFESIDLIPDIDYMDSKRENISEKDTKEYNDFTIEKVNKSLEVYISKVYYINNLINKVNCNEATIFPVNLDPEMDLDSYTNILCSYIIEYTITELEFYIAIGKNIMSYKLLDEINDRINILCNKLEELNN